MARVEQEVATVFHDLETVSWNEKANSENSIQPSKTQYHDPALIIAISTMTSSLHSDLQTQASFPTLREIHLAHRLWIISDWLFARTARSPRNRWRNRPRNQFIVCRMPLESRMEYVPHVTIIVRRITQVAILRQGAVQRIGHIYRQRPIRSILSLSGRTQTLEEAVLDPDLSAVAEAVAVKCGLQRAVVEHAETGVCGRVGCEKGVDGRDGLVQLLAVALRDVAFGKIGRGDLGVVELYVGDDDDLSALGLGREGAVEACKAFVKVTACLQRGVYVGEILSAAAEPAQAVDAGPDDGVEVEVIAAGRQGV